MERLVYTLRRAASLDGFQKEMSSDVMSTIFLFIPLCLSCPERAVYT